MVSMIVLAAQKIPWVLLVRMDLLLLIWVGL